MLLIRCTRLYLGGNKFVFFDMFDRGHLLVCLFVCLLIISFTSKLDLARLLRGSGICEHVCFVLVPV